jgi:hypothetical protein
MISTGCIALPKDYECSGPLAKPNQPCCDTCAERYRQLVGEGKISDYVNEEGLAGDVEVVIGILEEASN